MIKLEMENGAVRTQVEGQRMALLAELSIGFGHILAEVLKGVPEDLKKEMIKGVFECTLKEIEREAQT